MAREKPIALLHHGVEARVAVGRQAPPRQQRQFEPALVVAIDRLVERERLADVHQHRDVQPTRGLEHRIELRIVHRHARAALVAHADAEILEELQPDRAGRHVALQLRRGALAESRPHTAAEVEVCKENHAPRMVAARDCLDAALQHRPRSPAQVDEDAQVERIHLADDAVPAAHGKTGPVMAVHVHRGVPGAGHGVLVYHQRGARLVLLDGERRLVARLCGGGPRLRDRGQIGRRRQQRPGDCGERRQTDRYRETPHHATSIKDSAAARP